MFSTGSIENPLRFLFGPGPGEAACMAYSPQCMGWIPFLLGRVGIGS